MFHSLHRGEELNNDGSLLDNYIRGEGTIRNSSKSHYLYPGEELANSPSRTDHIYRERLGFFQVLEPTVGIFPSLKDIFPKMEAEGRRGCSEILYSGGGARLEKRHETCQNAQSTGLKT